MINGISTGAGALIDTTRSTPTAPAGGAHAAAKPTAAAEDRGAVTNSVAAMAAEGPPVDIDRITALRSAIRAGSYTPDAGKIAGRMIDTDLGAGL